MESEPNPQGIQSSDNSKINTDLEIVKAKLAWLEMGDKRVIQALSICASVLIAVTGIIGAVSWYNNKYTYDRDKEFMLQQIEDSNVKQMSLVQSNNEAFFSQLSIEQSDVFNKRANESIQKIEQISDMKLREMEADLSSMRRALADQKADMNLTISNYNRITETAASSIASRAGALETNLDEIDFKIWSARSVAVGTLFYEEARRAFEKKNYVSAAEYSLSAMCSYMDVPDVDTTASCLKMLTYSFSKMTPKQYSTENMKSLFSEALQSYAVSSGNDSKRFSDFMILSNMVSKAKAQTVSFTQPFTFIPSPVIPDPVVLKK